MVYDEVVLNGGGGVPPGLRFATPRAVFWRPFRALVVGMIGCYGADVWVSRCRMAQKRAEMATATPIAVMMPPA